MPSTGDWGETICLWQPVASMMDSNGALFVVSISVQIIIKEDSHVEEKSFLCMGDRSRFRSDHFDLGIRSGTFRGGGKGFDFESGDRMAPE
jgi:hypothetical protein